MPTIRIPSNRTLGKICVYGAVASISAVMFMRWKLEDRVRNENYYKLAIQAVRSHKGAVSLLGEPIKESGFDMSDINNSCNAEKAQFEVSVRGSKDKGTVFFWASKSDNGWLIDRLELETKQNPNKRFLLKKSSDDPVYALPNNLDQQKKDIFH
ncbi:cytochrome c oxidase assembly factor 1 homolog [Drosophila tropicalis]|uniref:cytochrome c oxidase assembly factor 1 homolog n=1 Tax=Drosophila tropicalis TaxID=46794 RepID=UPI0035AB9ECC